MLRIRTCINGTLAVGLIAVLTPGLPALLAEPLQQRETMKPVTDPGGDVTNTGAGGVLWDNDLIPDGVQGRAISPPAFPDIRVVDDFVIPEGEDWIIQDFHTNIIDDAEWTDGGVAEIYIYDDNNNSPGNLIISLTDLPFSKMKTGEIFFGRVDFDYWIEGLTIPLGSGRYWIGSRYPNGGGSGTNYWMTSSGQPDGPDTPGWFSFDAGQTWNFEGDPDIDRAFTITGILGGEPCPWDLDGGGFVGAGDLLILLANWGNPYGAADLLALLADWGDCPGGAECKGQVCPDYTLDCNPDDNTCGCYTLVDGSGFCGEDIPCGDAIPCDGDGDCPPGFRCAILTCCGDQSICVPVCDGVPGLDAPGGQRTSTGR